MSRPAPPVRPPTAPARPAAALLGLAALGCLPDTGAPEVAPGPAPARYVGEVTLFLARGDDPCAVPDLNQAVACATAAATGAPDGRGVALAAGSTLRLRFSTAPAPEVPGDDLFVHALVPRDAPPPLVEASADGVRFSALLPRVVEGGLLADAGVAGVRLVEFVQITQTDDARVVVDTVEALGVGALAPAPDPARGGDAGFFEGAP